MILTTRTRIENNPYPVLTITWESKDCLGWEGSATIWDGPNEKREEKHAVSLRQSIPLGGIYIAVDEVSYGAWAFGTFEGTGLTERDLQWAALYTIEAIKRRWMMAHATVDIFAPPFEPWWDVKRYGHGGECGVCGARLVRPKDGRKGWLCMSCGTFVEDKEGKQ